MRISVTYLYTIFKYGYPPAVPGIFQSLKQIASMGFHYLEMEGLGDEPTQQLWEHRQEAMSVLKDIDKADRLAIFTDPKQNMRHSLAIIRGEKLECYDIGDITEDQLSEDTQ